MPSARFPNVPSAVQGRLLNVEREHGRAIENAARNLLSGSPRFEAITSTRWEVVANLKTGSEFDQTDFVRWLVALTFPEPSIRRLVQTNWVDLAAYLLAERLPMESVERIAAEMGRHLLGEKERFERIAKLGAGGNRCSVHAAGLQTAGRDSEGLPAVISRLAKFPEKVVNRLFVVREGVGSGGGAKTSVSRPRGSANGLCETGEDIQ